MTEPSAWTAVGAASSPTFSLDGNTIFHLRGAGLPQVWAMRRDGSGAVQLADQGERAARLRRAPDSDRLLWSIDAGGDERDQVWLLDPGGTPRALTSDPRVNHEAGAFSPDGSRIAFAANDRDEACFDILVMDLASGGRRRISEGAGSRSVTNWTGERFGRSILTPAWRRRCPGRASPATPPRGSPRMARGSWRCRTRAAPTSCACAALTRRTASWKPSPPRSGGMSRLGRCPRTGRSWPRSRMPAAKDCCASVPCMRNGRS